MSCKSNTPIGRYDVGAGIIGRRRYWGIWRYSANLGTAATREGGTAAGSRYRQVTNHDRRARVLVVALVADSERLRAICIGGVRVAGFVLSFAGAVMEMSGLLLRRGAMLRRAPVFTQAARSAS